MHLKFCHNIYTFSKQALVFTCLQYKTFENTVEKGEIARNKQFLLFPTVFSVRLGELSVIFSKFEIVACKLLQFERVENVSFGKGLKVFQSMDRYSVIGLKISLTEKIISKSGQNIKKTSLDLACFRTLY